MTPRLLPRSVRGRLVAAYSAAALVLGAAGAVLFVVQLSAGLQAGLDVALDNRAGLIVEALREPGTPDLTDFLRTTPSTTTRDADLASITTVLRPDATVAGSDPVGLDVGAVGLPTAGRNPDRVTRAIADQQVRLRFEEVIRADGIWTVVVGAGQDTADDAVDRVQRALIVSGAVLIALVALGAWFLSGAALRPVERLRADADALSADDGSRRLTEPGTDPQFVALTRTLNALLDRLHSSVARQQDLVADAGHELRTPLSILRAELELAARPGRSVAELTDAVFHAGHTVERLSRLADDLLFLAAADSGRSELLIDRADLADLVRMAARAATAAAGPVALTVDAPAELWCNIDAGAVRRAVDNLLANSLAATAGSGQITLIVRSGREAVTVEVRDSGPGFDPAFLPHAFERFRRADLSRRGGSGGAGLGLSLVAEIAHAHGGAVSAGNPTDGGAVVTVTLPQR